MPSPIFLSSLPSLVIDTRSTSISDLAINCTIQVLAPYTNTTSGQLDYEASVKLQGHSAKPSYALTTFVTASILEFPSHTMWVLKGAYADLSLMRDALAFEIGRRTGEYAPRTRFVELYINGVSSGIYSLEEKIVRDPARVAISEDDYLLKVDSAKSAFKLLLTNTFIRIESGQSSNVIGPLANAFETRLLGPKWLEEPAVYRRHISQSNWINYFLMTETVRSSDAYNEGLYFFVQNVVSSPIFSLGPGWDYNIALGNAGDQPGDFVISTGWRYERLLNTSSPGFALWYWRVLADVAFQQATSARWRELRQDKLSDSNILGVIQGFTAELNESVYRQNIAAPWLEAVANLSQWVVARMQWIDSAIGLLPHEAAYGPGSACTQNCGPGTILDDNCTKTPFLPPSCAARVSNDSASRCLELTEVALNSSCPAPVKCVQVVSGWMCMTPQQIYTNSPTSSPSLSPSSLSPSHSPSPMSSHVPSTPAPSAAPDRKSVV